MLVLSRKEGEQIVVPECNMRITILEIRGDRVRIGIAAPPDIHIFRSEVWMRIEAAQEESKVVVNGHAQKS